VTSLPLQTQGGIVACFFCFGSLFIVARSLWTRPFSPYITLWGPCPRLSVTAFLPFMFMGCIFLIHGGREWGLVSWYRCGQVYFSPFSLPYDLSSLYFPKQILTSTHTFTMVIYPEHGRLNWGWSVSGSGMVGRWGVSMLFGFLGISLSLVLSSRMACKWKTCKGNQLLVGRRGVWLSFHFSFHSSFLDFRFLIFLSLSVGD